MVLIETNPAYRLMSFLEAAKSCMPKSNSNPTWSAILAECYSIPKNDYFSVTRVAAALATLPREVDALVRASPANEVIIPDDCLGWVGEVEQKLCMWHLEEGARTTIERISTIHGPLIKICGGIIARSIKSREVDFDAVEKLRSKLQTLHEEVRNADSAGMDYHLKRFVLSQLETIIYALVDCRILGREVLYNATADVWGRFRFHPQRTAEAEKTVFWPKVREVMRDLVLVSASIGAVKAIGDTFADFLPDGEFRMLEGGQNAAADDPPADCQ